MLRRSFVFLLIIIKTQTTVQVMYYLMSLIQSDTLAIQQKQLVVFKRKHLRAMSGNEFDSHLSMLHFV